MLYVSSRMDKERYIKEELEAVRIEQYIKGETDWPVETQFSEVVESNNSWIGEDGTVALPSQPCWSWKTEINDFEDEVNEEIEQKFVCGFPSNDAETSSYVRELIPEERKPFLIDGIYDGYSILHETPTNESYHSKQLTVLRPLVVQDIPLINNSPEHLQDIPLTSNLPAEEISQDIPPASNSLIEENPQDILLSSNLPVEDISQNIPLTSISPEQENSSLTNQIPVEKKARIQRCPVCKEVIKSPVVMKDHSLDHAELWPYTCSMCKRVFTRRYGFHQHMLTKHGVDRPYACNVCKMTFKEMEELNKHNLNHNGKWPYFCNLCNKAFTRNYGYRQHMKLHGVLRPHKCSTCQKTFSRRLDLERHMSEHDPEDGTFCCNICGRPFTVRARLIRHLATHSEDRPHSCTLCDKSFKCRATLAKHIAWHSGERRYVCTKCGKAFRFTFNLKRHMLLHLEDGRNVCTVCGKSFKRGFYFRKHKLKHEKDPAT